MRLKIIIMKKNVIKNELSQLSLNDLKEKIDALRRELFSLRINAATAHVKDYSQYKKIRKDIARALTDLGHRDKMTKNA